MKRRLFAPWLALGSALLAMACKDLTRPDATGSIALQIMVPPEPVADGPARSPAQPSGHLTSATATAISGTTTKTITLTGGAGSASFTGTITALPLGSYTVIVQGFVGGVVDYYGQTAGVPVSANVTTNAIVTFQSFIPTLSAFSPATTWSFRPLVNITSLPNATSYVIESDRSNTFPNPTKTTVTGTAGASFSVSDTGTYYVRVRAANSTVASGGTASATQSVRVTKDLRTRGDSAAVAPSLGFGTVANATLDSLNIYPAADNDWFKLSECNGDSLTITAQAVRLSPPSPLNSSLQVFSGTGRLLVQNDDADSTDARAGMRLSADGTYYVRVRGSNNTVGHYKLLTQVSVGANNLGSSCKVQALAVTSLSAGPYHTCAVRATGATDCWGYGLLGQLGNGGTSTTSSPTRVSGSVVFTSVTVGSLHSCGIANTGLAYCWGYNFSGQIGNGQSGSSANQLAPAATSGGRTYTQLSAGDWFTCGLSGTQIYCWGLGADGRLGNGSLTDQSIPFLVSGGLAFQAVGAGNGHACGLTTGGFAYCWGLGASGQLGNGGTGSSNTPVAVLGGLTFVELSVGAFHACARTSGGAVYCWGQNDIGQLGNGTTTNASSPVLVSGSGSSLVFTKIAGGRLHTCGLVSGVAYCWGNNYDGQVGDGTNLVRSSPAAVSTAITFTSITAGGWHTCAIRVTPSEAYCWGWNGLGQIGDASAFENIGPVAVSGGVAYNNISTGHQHTCAVSGAGVGYCWGWNYYGQLGDGTTTDRSTPATVFGGLVFTQIVSGAYHSCGLASGGAAYCWGYNASGQLGNGTFSSSATPLLVSGGQVFVQLSAGDEHNCGRTSTNILCWGENGEGQLGNNSTVDSPNLVTPSIGGTWRDVSAGGDVSCLVTNIGQPYCWGNNASGSLGNGNTTNSLTPVAVVISGGLSFNRVVAGLRHACGITTSNVVYCWGRNATGQLGIGSTSNSSTPVQVSGGLTWSSISASRDENSCGTTSNNLAYCWGGNFFGQLGDGTIISGSTTPKQVLANLAFANVQSGDTHTCGLLPTTNTAFCWGDNQRGQLGNGTTTTRLTPVAVLTGPASVPPVASSGYLLPLAEAKAILERRAAAGAAQAPSLGPSRRSRLR